MSMYPFPELGDKLTKQELKVLALLGKGSSNKKIAESLDISVRTVETHRAHIVMKTGKLGGELIIYAYQQTKETGNETV